MFSDSTSNMNVCTMQGGAMAAWGLSFTHNNKVKRHFRRCAPCVHEGPRRATGLGRQAIMHCKRLS